MELENLKRVNEDTIRFYKENLDIKENKIHSLEKIITENENQYVQARLHLEEGITKLKNDVLEGAMVNEDNSKKIQLLTIENEALNKTLSSLRDDYEHTTSVKIQIIKELEEKLLVTSSEKYNIGNKLTSELNYIESN